MNDLNDDVLIEILNERFKSGKSNISHIKDFMLNPNDFFLDDNGIPTDSFLESIKHDKILSKNSDELTSTIRSKVFPSKFSNKHSTAVKHKWKSYDSAINLKVKPEPQIDYGSSDISESFSTDFDQPSDFEIEYSANVETNRKSHNSRHKSHKVNTNVSKCKDTDKSGELDNNKNFSSIENRDRTSIPDHVKLGSSSSSRDIKSDHIKRIIENSPSIDRHRNYADDEIKAVSEKVENRLFLDNVPIKPSQNAETQYDYIPKVEDKSVMKTSSISLQQPNMPDVGKTLKQSSDSLDTGMNNNERNTNGQLTRNSKDLASNMFPRNYMSMPLNYEAETKFKSMQLRIQGLMLTVKSLESQLQEAVSRIDVKDKLLAQAHNRIRTYEKKKSQSSHSISSSATALTTIGGASVINSAALKYTEELANSYLVRVIVLTF